MDMKKVQFQIDKSIDEMARMMDLTSKEIKRKLAESWEVENE